MKRKRENLGTNARNQSTETTKSYENNEKSYKRKLEDTIKQ